MGEWRYSGDGCTAIKRATSKHWLWSTAGLDSVEKRSTLSLPEFEARSLRRPPRDLFTIATELPSLYLQDSRCPIVIHFCDKGFDQGMVWLPERTILSVTWTQRENTPDLDSAINRTPVGARTLYFPNPPPNLFNLTNLMSVDYGISRTAVPLNVSRITSSVSRRPAVPLSVNRVMSSVSRCPAVPLSVSRVMSSISRCPAMPFNVSRVMSSVSRCPAVPMNVSRVMSSVSRYPAVPGTSTRIFQIVFFVAIWRTA
jgi:hypothetical protein